MRCQLDEDGFVWVICSPSESRAMATHETRFQVVKSISFRDSYKRYFRGREWFLARGFITCIVDAGEVCVHSEEFGRAWHANRLRIEEERRESKNTTGYQLNFVCIMSGFSCQSSILTHIYGETSAKDPQSGSKRAAYLSEST